VCISEDTFPPKVKPAVRQRGKATGPDHMGMGIAGLPKEKGFLREAERR